MAQDKQEKTDFETPKPNFDVATKKSRATKVMYSSLQKANRWTRVAMRILQFVFLNTQTKWQNK
jgi:hypothetical protein